MHTVTRRTGFYGLQPEGWQRLLDVRKRDMAYLRAELEHATLFWFEDFAR